MTSVFESGSAGLLIGTDVLCVAPGNEHLSLCVSFIEHTFVEHQLILIRSHPALIQRQHVTRCFPKLLQNQSLGKKLCIGRQPIVNRVVARKAIDWSKCC